MITKVLSQFVSILVKICVVVKVKKKKMVGSGCNLERNLLNTISF